MESAGPDSYCVAMAKLSVYIYADLSEQPDSTHYGRTYV